MKCLLLCLAVIAAVPLSTCQVDYRLPGDVIPTSYTVLLLTNIGEFNSSNPDTFRYQGLVNITLTAAKDNVSSIVLHSHRDITVEQIRKQPINNGNVVTLNTTGTFDSATEKLTIDIQQTLSKGQQLNIIIIFNGINQDDGDGFYRTFYTDNGVVRWLLSTQFEPLGARKAFPCFDEPQYKALFRVLVQIGDDVSERGYHVLSNTNIEAVLPQNETGLPGLTYVFEETPVPLPTYLVAFHVSDYKSFPPSKFNSSYPDPSLGEDKELRTWAKPAYVNDNRGQITGIAAPALMEIYTRFFNIGFGYHKLDQVAVTNYGGGMENWGLVVYGEYVLFDEDPDSVVSLTAHELGHQWFGDLVTCQWWGVLWVNEGFATYLATHGAAEIREEGLDTSGWDLEWDFVVGTLQSSAFPSDDVTNHAMTFDVVRPQDIKFDNIEYSKAGCVIRMWRHILGVDTFNKGLGLYLKQNAAGSGTPDLLLSAFNAVANESASNLGGQTPSSLFDAWHLQIGYPIVNVQRSSQDPRTFVVTQYVFSLRDEEPAASNQSWHIPISYSTDFNYNFNNTQAVQWLDNSGDTKQISFTRDVKWIVVNNQETGYYRVNYDLDNWDQLTIALVANPESIHPINREQILDDFFNIGRSTAKWAASVTYDRVLTMATARLSTTMELRTWKTGLRNLQYLRDMMVDDPIVYPYLKQFLMTVMEGAYQDLTMDTRMEDTRQDKKLRTAIMSWMCSMGHEKCIRTAQQQVASNAITDLNRDTRGTILAAAVRSGEYETWLSILQKYSTTEDLRLKKDLRQALGATKDRRLLHWLLSDTVREDGRVPRGERKDLFLAVLNDNPENAQLAFQFLSENVDLIAKMYPGWNPVGELLQAVAGFFKTEDMLKQVTALRSQFAASSELKARTAAADVEIAENIILANIDWMRMRKPQVAQWLMANSWRDVMGAEYARR